MIRLLPLLLLTTCMFTEEQWKPLEHPATIDRQLTGYTQAIYTANLSSEVNARILSIPLDVGQTAADKHTIHLDDSLALIDLRLANAQFKQAQSQLQTAEASLGIAQSEAKYRIDEKSRINKLIEQAVASDEQRDAIVFRADQARFAVLRQLASVENAKQQVAVAQAQIAHAQEIATRHHVKIPVGWTVSQRFIETHALAQIGAPILQIQDLRTLIMRFALSEEEVNALRTDKTPHIVLNQNQQRIACTIKSINSAFNPQTRKREVILQAPASQFPEQSGGLSCTLTIRIPDPNNGVRIPHKFISQRFEQQRVMLSDNNWLPIIILRSNQDTAIIQRQQLPKNCTLIIPHQEKVE